MKTEIVTGIIGIVRTLIGGSATAFFQLRATITKEKNLRNNACAAIAAEIESIVDSPYCSIELAIIADLFVPEMKPPPYPDGPLKQTNFAYRAKLEHKLKSFQIRSNLMFHFGPQTDKWSGLQIYKELLCNIGLLGHCAADVQQFYTSIQIIRHQLSVMRNINIADTDSFQIIEEINSLYLDECLKIVSGGRAIAAELRNAFI